MADLKDFAEQLVNLSVKEVSELAEILKEEYGIEPAAAAAPVMVAGGGAEGGAGCSPERTDGMSVLCFEATTWRFGFKRKKGVV